MNFGVDYYPEHWNKERWNYDIDLMLDLGIDVVRMAEFSWSTFEPDEGKYDFSLLDDIIERFAKKGIKVILGTPSAAPPAWIINKHPEIQPIDYEGRVRHFGGRHHACQSNETYRRYISKYVHAFIKHFSNNNNVVGWQIDNELGNSHEDLCYCDSCQKKFRKWLEKKYSNIVTLNEKWGTVFWSQAYNNFDEIIAPIITVTGENPSAVLDWKKFCSDLIVDFHDFQLNIIRKFSEKFVTHNLMGFANKVNYYDLGKKLDFASHDQYPGLFHIEGDYIASHKLSATLDLIRAVKDAPFWIMEQQSGITGWEVLGRLPKPGQLGLWSAQSIAHGADCIIYFRWRTCTFGTEQYWHGILPHNGKPGRNYFELQEFIKKFKPLLKEIQGSMPKNEVGILFSYNQEYAIQIQPHTSFLNYTAQVQKYYQALYELNVPVDFLPEDGDFNKYKILVAPMLYLMSEDLENKLVEYVEKGGVLLLTMRTGVKDEFNICRTNGYLPTGKLTDLLGIEIHEYDCLKSATGEMKSDNQKYEYRDWADIITLTTADSVAQYASDFYSEQPCVTKNKYGRGISYYVGNNPEISYLRKLLSDVLKDADISEGLKGLEIVERSADNIKYIFVLNHDDEEKAFEKSTRWDDYFDQQDNEVPAFGVNVYTEEINYSERN